MNDGTPLKTGRRKAWESWDVQEIWTLIGFRRRWGVRLDFESLVFLNFLSIKNGSWSIGTPNVFFVLGFRIRTIGFGAIAVFECVHLVRCHAGPGPVLGARRSERTVATPSPKTNENVL